MKSYVLKIRTGMKNLVNNYFPNFDMRLYLQLVQTFNVQHPPSDLIFGKHCQLLDTPTFSTKHHEH